jgi:hypothetical protein
MLHSIHTLSLQQLAQSASAHALMHSFPQGLVSDMVCTETGHAAVHAKYVVWAALLTTAQPSPACCWLAGSQRAVCWG